MRLLITGATGYIGRRLVNGLQEFSGNIQVLLLTHNKSLAQDYFPANRFEFIAISDDMEDLVEFSPQIVIHLAALNYTSGDINQTINLINSNIVYGVELLNKLIQCPDFKVFINAGSFSEYASSDGRKQCSNFYSLTKSVFKEFLDYYSDNYNFKYIDAILYSVYGGEKTIKRIVDYIIESIDSPIPVRMTPGEQRLDFIHIDDVVAFFKKIVLKFISNEKINTNYRYYIGTGQNFSIRDVSAIVEEITGKRCNINWGGLSYRKNEIMEVNAPIYKNENFVEWQSTIDIKTGLKNALLNNEQK